MNKSCAFPNSAFAISPVKCASRPFSSAKVSKIPNFAPPSFTAYQVTVPGSFSANDCADFKNSATVCSLPGFASTSTQIASFDIISIPLLQLRVLRFGFLQDGDVVVGVFPKGQKLLIHHFCLRGVTGHHVRSRESQMRKRSQRTRQHESRMIQNLLIFPCSLCATMQCEISRASQVGWVIRSAKS